MKFLAFVVSYMTFCSTFQLCCASPQQTQPIQWQFHYDRAFEQAKASAKPLLLFFTGSNWCEWCTRLEEEILNTVEFNQVAGPHFVFVKLDFPLDSLVDPEICSQNKELRKKFDVRIFPTVILIDEQGKKIGSTGYRSGDGKEYANYLLHMVSEYRRYQHRFSDLEKTSISEQELQSLYEKARHLQRDSEAVNILQVGLKDSNSLYFLKEKYRFLAEEGKIHQEEALSIKNQLLSQDPLNERHTHYDLAVIEFETLCNEMDKGNFIPETTLSPLIHYIEKFRSQDLERIWRIQMIVSQVYLDNNQPLKALKYARQSYEDAPASVKPEIASVVDNIELYLHKSNF